MHALFALISFILLVVGTTNLLAAIVQGIKGIFKDDNEV